MGKILKSEFKLIEIEKEIDVDGKDESFDILLFLYSYVDKPPAAKINICIRPIGWKKKSWKQFELF